MLKKFFEWTGPIATCILLSALFIRISGILGGNSLNELISWNIFGIMTSILGLTLASITFFITKIIELEEKFGKAFNETRKELHDNIFLSLTTVIVYLLIIVIFPINQENLATQQRIYIILLSLIFLQFFSFIEVCIVMVKFKTIKDNQ